MNVQKMVSKSLNELKVSKVYDTIIEGQKGKYFLGRSAEMAPEIDGVIYIDSNKNLSKGDIIKVKIKEALEYDLIGEVYNEFSK